MKKTLILSLLVVLVMLVGCVQPEVAVEHSIPEGVLEEEVTVDYIEEIKEKDTELVKIKFYRPDDNAEKVIYEEVEVDLMHVLGEIWVLQEGYKLSSKSVFTANTKINNLEVKEDILYIDLNKSFTEEMNAGSGVESMILESVANTFGNFYGVDKVILTIDSELYTSGHIEMKEGEYIEVTQ